MSDISRIFRIKKTQLEMTRDRGYSIEEEKEILDMSVEEFDDYIEDKKHKENLSTMQALSGIYEMKFKEEPKISRMIVYYGIRSSARQKKPLIDIVKEFIKRINYETF